MDVIKSLNDWLWRSAARPLHEYDFFWHFVPQWEVVKSSQGELRLLRDDLKNILTLKLIGIYLFFDIPYMLMCEGQKELQEAKKASWLLRY